MDLRPMVLGIPYTLICFRQTNPEDLPLLARSMFTPLLNFDPLRHEVERDGGMELLPIVERTGSTAHGTGWNDTWSQDESESDTENWQHSIADALNWTKGRALQESDSEQETRAHQDSRGLSQKRDPKFPALLPQEQTDSSGSSNSLAKARGKARATSESETRGGATTRTAALGGATTRARRRGRGGSISGTESQTEGWAVRHIQVRKTIREWQETGQLRRSIADQLEQYAQQLFCLGRQEAFVRIGATVHRIRTVDVPDPFLSASAIVKAVDWLARELAAIHGYLFLPDLSLAEEERRVRRYLGLGAAADEADDEEPVAVGSDEESPFG